MSGARYISTMEEWMRDIQRRVQLLERRRPRPYQTETAAMLSAGEHEIVLPENTRVVSAEGRTIIIRVDP